MPRCSIRDTARRRAGARQSIAILDLSNNQLHDFPDDRLSDDYSTRQSYFIGLAFSSDGNISMPRWGRSPTPPARSRRAPAMASRSTNSRRTSYSRTLYQDCAAVLAEGKEVAFGLRKTPAGTALPYPAGFAVLPGAKGDRLLIANNLSDNVVLLDVSSGEIEKSFDLSRSRYVPSAYPYTVIANKAGTKAWVSLWNASRSRGIGS
jgi:hypothetical protein